MKSKFIKVLPLAAAVLFATSCSKDDSNDEVVANPVQQEVKQEKKTITVTGKLSTKSGLSKFGLDKDNNFTFSGNERIYMDIPTSDENPYEVVNVSNPQKDGTFTFEIVGIGDDEFDEKGDLTIKGVEVTVKGENADKFTAAGTYFGVNYEDAYKAIIASATSVEVTIHKEVTSSNADPDDDDSAPAGSGDDGEPTEPEPEPTYTFSCGEVTLSPKVAIIKNLKAEPIRVFVCNSSDNNTPVDENDGTEVPVNSAVVLLVDSEPLTAFVNKGEGWGNGKVINEAKVYKVSPDNPGDPSSSK